MYIPIWVLCLLSVLCGAVVTFLVMVGAVVISNKNNKKGD